jgi:O-antigen ligase
VLRGSGTNHSATAILGFIVCTAVLFALQFIKGRARQAKRILLWGTVAFLLSVPVMLMVVEAFDMTPAEAILEATGRDMTLSDRTYLWKDLLDNAAKTRTFGVGFGAFWVGPLGYELYPFPNWAKVTRTWRPREGHNGYIDVYVDLGLVGLVLMLLVILFAVLSTLDDLESRFEFGRLRVILLLSILINNFAESSFLNGTHALWFMFLLAGVRVPNAAQRAKSFTVARLRRVVAPQVLRVPAGGMAHSLYRGGVMTPKMQLRRP